MKERSVIIREAIFAFLLKPLPSGQRVKRTSTFVWASTQGAISQQTGRTPSRREVQQEVDKLLDTGSVKMSNGEVVLAGI